MPEFTCLTVTLTDAIAQIELNRPDKANALNGILWREIGEVFRWVDETPEARVAILSGAGRHFCAGIDFELMGAVLDEVEPAFSVDTTGSVTEPGSAVRSKLAQGEAYGMREASSIGREWYEQSEGFCHLLTGKTVSELRGIPSNGADADLASVCTINITAFLASAVKAVDSAA